MINFELPMVFSLLNELASFESHLKTRSFAVEAKKWVNSEIVDQIKQTVAAHERKIPKEQRPEWDAAMKQAREFFGEHISLAESRQLGQVLMLLAGKAQALELVPVMDRIAIFSSRSEPKTAVADIHSEVSILRETLEYALKDKQFYLYPREKVRKLQMMSIDWERALTAFPQIEDDVRSAIDCYAFESNTASVFHSMRAVEHGLREFAAAVNVEFKTQQWHNVIGEIESAIREIGDKWRASPAKAHWMRFYAEAAKEFFYFKDGWRNYVSHRGQPYDEHQALIVLDHVRAFMNHLGARLA